MLIRARVCRQPRMTRGPITKKWLDKCLLRSHPLIMSQVRVIFLSALVALLALGTVTHAVSANAMALDIAMSEGGEMSMPDCQGCPEDGDSDANTLCDLVCTAPVTAVLKGVDIAQPAAPLLRQDHLLGMTTPRGLRAPPDPFPPRPFI
ncbi:hypothetical protein [Nisaea denitrificans]|uniref:hypothetical protein n=1 Tax=Nisaea denitrificans TaxID=390877 RepID=UPI0012EB6AE3|nr:hypothetical protein [Nisaea denitrificans]